MIKRNIPNAITCGNLFCGCLAIVQAFNGELILSAYLVGIAAILDFFDGFAARLLKVSSPIGKDLDSLADMVTFGVVPGIILFKLTNSALNINFEGAELIQKYSYLCYITFIIPIFSAIRLAKFNNDTRQSESFIGLPTPANAILICSIPLVVNWHPQFTLEEFNAYEILLNPVNLIISSFILSLLLVAELPLFALKFKQFKWQGNEIRYLFLFFSLIMIILLHEKAIPLIIISYVIFSMINNFIKKSHA